MPQAGGIAGTDSSPSPDGSPQLPQGSLVLHPGHRHSDNVQCIELTGRVAFRADGGHTQWRPQ